MKKKKSKSVKSIIRSLKKKAFDLWSLKVRKIGICALCGAKYKEVNLKGKPIILNAHHLISRNTSNILAWDVKNGISLCQNCHKFKNNGPHKNGLIFTNWYIKNYPSTYQYLLDNWQIYVEITVEYLENIIKTLSVENIIKNTK